MMAESFPCIICGVSLRRVDETTEGQPDDGIMCMSYGNYGSTVFDPMDLSYLAFNICDPCLINAGKAGRVFTTRDRQHVKVHGFGIVGAIRTDKPYVQWRKDLPGDECEHGMTLELEELEQYADRITFNIPLEDIKRALSNNG